ncbi:hypothetical protein MLD38_019385 [Melastoma candidum]|uniref:Uncharacterized protein n=1 Tax=Melastoma candidum TaxID=119954 RepID=A0ACB9QVZ7_9MYRT|nr:hypothetical protein MLD38_019385 [Melastoma candidum]
MAPSSPGQSGSSSSKGKLIGITASCAAAVVVIGVLVFFIAKRKKRPMQGLTTREVDDVGGDESLQFNFDIVRSATDNFSDINKLGQGGFGPVFKGKLPNGQEIAVKRLSRGSEQGEVEFKNEVGLLVRLQHRNLVRLLGYCLRGDEKLLVYEFLPNSSLDRFIFGELFHPHSNPDKHNDREVNGDFGRVIQIP